ncbi:MAG TPA: Vps62-related protein [Myxococcota bacterium]|nr:Vps62-related protein [Myxococcota bacterium]
MDAAPVLSAAVNIVSKSVGIAMAAAEGNPIAILSAVGELHKYLFGLTSPQEEPLTKQMQTMFHQELTSTWIALFNANLQGIVTWFHTEYFPRACPREDMTPAEIEDTYNTLTAKYEQVLRLRDMSGADGFEETGLPTYLAAQNLLMMILAERASFDPKTADPRASTVSTHAAPEIVDQAHAHVQRVTPRVLAARAAEIVESASPTSNLVGPQWRYGVRDVRAGLSTGQTENKDTAMRLREAYTAMAKDKTYADLGVATCARQWDAALDRDVPAPPLELAWVEVRTAGQVLSCTGKRGTLRVFQPEAPPAGFHLVGGVACEGDLPAGTRALALKAIDPSALAAPLRFERVWSTLKTSSSDRGSLWRPVMPAGYTALGHVASDHESNPPDLSSVRGVRSDLVGSTLPVWLWNDKKTSAADDGTVWQVCPEAPYPSGGFVAVQEQVPDTYDIGPSYGQDQCWQLKALRYDSPVAR